MEKNILRISSIKQIGNCSELNKIEKIPFKMIFCRSSLFILTLLIVLFQGFSLTYASSYLDVQKIIQNKEVKVGDDVTILLKFSNPFGKELPIKIVDRNIFGNNGIEVQCLEYVLPSEKDAAVGYEPVRPFKAGSYNLEAAQVTYTNPETGKEEIVKSNELKVSVKDSGTQQGQEQGITTIYRCNGMNMQSTSYSSSGSSFNIQVGSKNNEQQAQTQEQQQSVQNRVENNQVNQNTNELKQEMQKQFEQQKQEEDEFKQNIEKNPQFQKQHNDLLKEGYNLTDASFSPSNGSTGNFKLGYKKQNGETASMKADMEDGKIKNMLVQTAQERQKMFQALQQNKKAQQYNNQLEKKDFTQSQPVFEQLTQNQTKITVPYQNNKNEERNINADYINGTIQNVKLEGNDNDNFPWLIASLALLLLIAAAAAWIIYKKYSKKAAPKINMIFAEPKAERIDYLKEARKMIEHAEKLFENGHEKDAYEKVSAAIRFYFSYRLKINKELTGAELLGIMKKEKIKGQNDAQKCLSLCGLVEFAKYNANKNDFGEIIRIAKRIIV